jgi:NADPH:quinone reductase-like Zn-dependent oxidoreductase
LNALNKRTFKMKALIRTKYGSPDVLGIQDTAMPIPRGNEVLVKVQAVAINAADLHMLSGKPLPFRLMGIGLFKPKFQILGAAVSGYVEAIGGNANRFHLGDEVFGDLSACGWGGFAEYVCAKEDALVSKPAKLSFDQAAAVPMAAVTALQGLRDKGHIQAGQQVLINGASGGVGTFAVQIAKSFGADVTAICSTGNVEAARSMGADHVIDYTKENFARNGMYYDLILAANGDRSIFDYKRALSPTGTYVMTGGSTRQMFQAMVLGPWISMMGNKKMCNLLAKPSNEDLTFLSELLNDGTIVPIIDKTYSLNEGAEAVRYLEQGHARGKVVITIR